MTMTPRQYRAALGQLGLSQQAAGKLFGASGRSGQNWVVKGPPTMVAILIRLLLEGVITQEQIEHARR